MRGLLVLLSMLYGANALGTIVQNLLDTTTDLLDTTTDILDSTTDILKTNILVPGCDADLIKKMDAYPSISLDQFPPGVYFVATESTYTVLIDSSTLTVEEVYNNQSNAVVYLCVAGVQLPLIYIDYTDTGRKWTGDNFPILGESADFYTIACGDGLFLTYLCDPRKPTGVGLISDYAFTIEAKPDVTVTSEALAACEAVARTLYAPAKFTPLITGGCKKL